MTAGSKTAATAKDRVPFTLATTVGRERAYVEEALSSHTLTGEGKFTKLCEQWLEGTLNAKRAMLVPSCTAALEMATILLDLQPGDEVIMPSFTYVSTANAVVLRGAVPVFVDIRADTMNIDEKAIAAAITPKTRAIIVVHYAGHPCAMDEILRIANAHNLSVIEDAAQGLLSRYGDQYLGTIGRFGCFSFHGTKNMTCGHGGALLVNRPEDLARADIVRDRGTDRKRFLEGDIQKYSWVDVGSSYFLSEICSAFLFAQLEEAQTITAKRIAICSAYRKALQPLHDAGHIELPIPAVPGTGNGHICFFLVPGPEVRAELLAFLKQHGVDATFHYTPLHTSPAGQRFGRTSGDLPNTESLSQRILRLPVFASMEDAQVEKVIETLTKFFV